MRNYIIVGTDIIVRLASIYIVLDYGGVPGTYMFFLHTCSNVLYRARDLKSSCSTV
jgi:hypothetical protein